MVDYESTSCVKSAVLYQLSYPNFKLGTGIEPVTATPVVLTAELTQTEIECGSRTHDLQNAIVLWITTNPSNQVGYKTAIHCCNGLYNGAIQKHATRLA
tara:strand:- start:301 stop:597 length:297 start_codon:yes stop_codon:yes gene_type:complete